MKRLFGWLVCVFVAGFASKAYAEDCYVGGGTGQSSIGLVGSEKLEERLFLSDFSRADFSQRKISTTWELFFGCTIWEEWGIKAEFTAVSGFEHSVRSDVTIAYDGRTENFTVDRLVSARGYMASVKWEGELSQKTSVFLRLGAFYAQATADAFIFDSEFSVHAEDSGFVPVIGLGGRFQVDDRWSVIAEGRLIGHPDVRQGVLLFQYDLNPRR